MDEKTAMLFLAYQRLGRAEFDALTSKAINNNAGAMATIAMANWPDHTAVNANFDHHLNFYPMEV